MDDLITKPTQTCASAVRYMCFYRLLTLNADWQMRAMVELLPFHAPKLSSIGVGFLNANDFASRLERAVNRSERAKLIEGHAIRDE
jgi:hypothetical protein